MNAPTQYLRDAGEFTYDMWMHPVEVLLFAAEDAWADSSSPEGSRQRHRTLVAELTGLAQRNGATQAGIAESVLAGRHTNDRKIWAAKHIANSLDLVGYVEVLSRLGVKRFSSDLAEGEQK